jgi:hypothetical protein
MSITMSPAEVLVEQLNTIAERHGLPVGTVWQFVQHKADLAPVFRDLEGLRAFVQAHWPEEKTR